MVVQRTSCTRRRGSRGALADFADKSLHSVQGPNRTLPLWERLATAARMEAGVVPAPGADARTDAAWVRSAGRSTVAVDLNLEAVELLTQIDHRGRAPADRWGDRARPGRAVRLLTDRSGSQLHRLGRSLRRVSMRDRTGASPTAAWGMDRVRRSVPAGIEPPANPSMATWGRPDCGRRPTVRQTTPLDGGSAALRRRSWLAPRLRPVVMVPTVAQFSLSSQGRWRLGDPAWTEPYEDGRRLDSDRANQIADGLMIDLRGQLEVESAGLSPREAEVLRLVAAGFDRRRGHRAAGAEPAYRTRPSAIRSTESLGSARAPPPYARPQES
jgi:hypothetical protein